MIKYISTIWLLSLLFVVQSVKIEPKFVEVPLVSIRLTELSAYSDIINHSRQPFLTEGRTTNGHETTHMINSDLRQASKDGKKGFYVMYGKAVMLDEPKLRKRNLIPFLPQCLRSSRFDLYIVRSEAWDDRPTYIFDEWVAYTNGGLICIEDIERGVWREDRIDGVSGCLDFSIYAVSLCMAVEKHDPEFWANNKQFKDFVHWNLHRAYDIFKVGITQKQNKYSEQTILLDNLRNHKDAKPMRDFINKHFDGVFING